MISFLKQILDKLHTDLDFLNRTNSPSTKINQNTNITSSRDLIIRAGDGGSHGNGGNIHIGPKNQNIIQEVIVSDNRPGSNLNELLSSGKYTVLRVDQDPLNKLRTIYTLGRVSD